MTNTLIFEPALTRPELLAPSVAGVIERWRQAPWIDEVRVAEIDPMFARGVDLCEHYGLDLKQAGNCLILKASRAGRSWMAGCLVPPDRRTNLGSIVRKTLNAREISLLPKELAIKETEMEYGSITVIGLPEEWPVLIDASLAHAKALVIGSGVLRSKLRLPGEALVTMTNGLALTGLSREIE